MALSSESFSGPRPLPPGEASPTRILIAEDPFINTFLRTVLQRHGDKVIVGEAHQSASILQKGAIEVDLVITNTPTEFLEFSETIPLLYTASNPDPALASLFRHCRVLRKPFRNDDLLAAVEDLTRSL